MIYDIAGRLTLSGKDHPKYFSFYPKASHASSSNDVRICATMTLVLAMLLVSDSDKIKMATFMSVNVVEINSSQLTDIIFRNQS